MGTPTLFTIGYKGATIAPFVATLQEAGVERLIDVRQAARSRKRDFNKKRFREHLEAAGLEYVHHASVGAPKDARNDYLVDGDWDTFVVRYLDHMDNEAQQRGLDELEAMVRERRSAIACLCPDPARCHRGVLAERLERRGMLVRHLSSVVGLGD